MQASTPTSAFGRYMRQWRRQRGLSQLELANRADVTQRHISFIETGRSRPRSGVIHRVAEALEIPLRERNALLEAAGLPPCYPELPLSSDIAAPFHHAIQSMLDTHDPYPAYVVNRWWDIVNANLGGQRLLPPNAIGQVNAVDVFLGPGPMRAMVENFPTVAWTFLHRMRREVAGSGSDARLQELLQRAENYLQDVPPPPDDDIRSDLVICPRLRIGDQVVRTVSMIARFGDAREVTLDELRVELVFPYDDAAGQFFRQLAATP